jgi:hypothetical protein
VARLLTITIETALRDRPRSGGERDGLEREHSERSDHFALLLGENLQVLRFADLDTEERVTETTKEVAKDVHDSDYPVDRHESDRTRASWTRTDIQLFFWY